MLYTSSTDGKHMRFEELTDRLVIRDQQAGSRYFGIATFLLALTLAIVPWTIPIRRTSPKLYAEMSGATVVMMILAGFGARKFFKSPITKAVFERDSRRLVFTRRTLRPTVREVPFKMIEMVMVGEKIDGGGKIFRLAVGTRSGERLAISHWKRQADQVHEVARVVNLWVRDSLV
jgi:hypothetical protein